MKTLLKNIGLILIIFLNKNISNDLNIIIDHKNIAINKINKNNQPKDINLQIHKKKIPIEENQTLEKQNNNNNMISDYTTESPINVNQENNNKSFKTIFKEYKTNFFKDFWSNLGINVLFHIGYAIIFFVFIIVCLLLSINSSYSTYSINFSFILLFITTIGCSLTDQNNIINFLDFEFKWDKSVFISIDTDDNTFINPFLQSLPLTIILLTISVIIINLLKSLIFPKKYPKTPFKQLLFNSLFTACFLWLILFIFASLLYLRKKQYKI